MVGAGSRAAVLPWFRAGFCLCFAGAEAEVGDPGFGDEVAVEGVEAAVFNVRVCVEEFGGRWVVGAIVGLSRSRSRNVEEGARGWVSDRGKPYCEICRGEEACSEVCERREGRSGV